MKNKLKQFLNRFREKEIKFETIYMDNKSYKVKVVYYKTFIKSLLNKLIKAKQI